MIRIQQSALRYLALLFLATSLVACSDSGSSDPVTTGATTSNSLTDQNSTTVAQPESAGTTSGTDVAGQPGQTNGSNGESTGAETNPGPANSDSTGTENVAPDTETTATNNSVTETEQPTSEGTETEQPATEGTDSETSESEQPPSVTGSDESGNDDDSPTETESASIAGPFIKDATRSPGPPSVPEGLTLLMSGEDFLEFSWKPSTDDQSVESYEIYRDGVLVYTIEHDNTFEFNYRNWISTSYIDCNYTRFTGCEANPIVPGSSYQYQVAAIDNEGMKSALSAPVTFQLAQRQSGGPDLDTIINREQQYFVNLFGSDPIDADPFVFTGSSLQITGTVTPPNLLDAANGQPYLSGVISTKDKFEMTYGYVEMNAKLASGQGFLSTFYLFNQDFYKNKPEIDIIEYIGDRPDKAYQTYHYYDSNRARNSDGERHSTPTMETQIGYDLSADFHKFGVLWEPGLIVWYIDGAEVRRLTGVRVSDEPMNIIAQFVVGSEWIGQPDASSLPKYLEIDYIKAWQKP